MILGRVRTSFSTLCRLLQMKQAPEEVEVMPANDGDIERDHEQTMSRKREIVEYAILAKARAEARRNGVEE